MKPNPAFAGLPKEFWANVRHVSQEAGYTVRGAQRVSAPAMNEISEALRKYNLPANHLHDEDGQITDFGKKLLDYFAFRARTLNEYVEPRLMNKTRAKRVFNELSRNLKSKLPITMNKQKAAKKTPAYLTGIVNMLVEANSSGTPFEFNPRRLTTISNQSGLVRTLSRWFDGAFPSSNNPIAVWEVKEYYHTTTFGSRVADGVYESLLDGMELEELKRETGIDVKHYLMLDAHYTWWECGRAYLCRIVDMLHMGYVDEVFFGYEVVERLPAEVKSWVRQLGSA